MGWRRNAFEAFVKMNSFAKPSLREVPRLPNKVLVLRNNDIGDLLVITPLFEALRHTFPTAEIIAGIGDWNIDVLKDNPYVDRTISVNAPWHNHIVKPQTTTSALHYIFSSNEVKCMRKENIDIGIDVLGSGLGSLLFLQAHIAYRVGVQGYAGGHSVCQLLSKSGDNDDDLHVGARALRFAKLLGCRSLPENRPQIYLDSPVENHGAVVFAPGAGISEKSWPIEKFANLAASLNKKIFIVGGKSDHAAAEFIQSKAPWASNFAGKSSLRETFALIAGAAKVVTNGSMAMHVAAAFRKPTIVTLGPSFASAEQHQSLWGYPETISLLLPTPDEVRKYLA